MDIAGEAGSHGDEPFAAGREAQVMGDVRAAALKMLGERALGATICPSEVARVVAVGGAWRDGMPAVHSAVDAMLADGVIRLSWKGRHLDERKGPYRISLALDTVSPAPHGSG